MKWALALNLMIGFICLNTNSVESHSDHHSGHAHHSHEHQHHQNDAASAQVKKANFAVRLLDDLHHEAGMDENIVMSPMSIQTALIAIYKAAAGKTKEELGKYLFIKASESQKELASESDTLKQVFNKKSEFSYAEANLAVGLFTQKDFQVRKEYIDDVNANFLTRVETVDFNGKDATDTINKFASDLTKGRIPKLFSSPIDPATKLVLVSTTYFHGVWKNDFPAANTKVEKFNTGTKNIEVPMMSDKQNVLYYHDHALLMESIQIPYFDNNYVMGILLPHKNQTLMNLTHHLTGEKLHATFYEATSTAVEYKIPKMKISWAKSLKSVLEHDGLRSIFEKPDFSQLTVANNLKVSDVYHAAEVQVDEKGTVAAAATAAKFTTYAYVPPPTDALPFYADRPFLLTILHKPTSLILFQAFVHQPSGPSA